MGRKSRVDRTLEEEWQIVQEGMKSGNVSETCRRHGIAQRLYCRWKDEAEEMWCAGEMRVLDVAVACGFKTRQHFARVFRRAYRHRPAVGFTLRKRQEKLSEEVREIARKAQHRLHARYGKLMAKGKNKGVVVTAVGRELLGFIWAIGA